MADIDGIIREPGKFEGEEWWVPGAYDDSLNGCWDDLLPEAADYDGDDVVLYAVVGDDFKELNLPKDTFALVLYGDDMGFVYGARYTKEEFKHYYPTTAALLPEYS